MHDYLDARAPKLRQSARAVGLRSQISFPRPTQAQAVPRYPPRIHVSIDPHVPTTERIAQALIRLAPGGLNSGTAPSEKHDYCVEPVFGFAKIMQPSRAKSTNICGEYVSRSNRSKVFAAHGGRSSGARPR